MPFNNDVKIGLIIKLFKRLCISVMCNNTSVYIIQTAPGIHQEKALMLLYLMAK